MESNVTQSDILAVETHTGRRWSLIILLVLIIPAISAARVPASPVKFVLILAGGVGIFAFAMAWSGFQYRFLRHGLEIRMLGFRLRSIPRSAIVSYEIEPWSIIRGYGIRGLGSTRGATRSCISARRTLTFISATTIPRASSAIWIR